MVDINNVGNTVNVNRPAPAPEPRAAENAEKRGGISLDPQAAGTEESGARLAAPPAPTEKPAQ
ncbi:MAG: hypothetical protein ACE5GQ_07730, partial [Nitrospinales bacterium]